MLATPSRRSLLLSGGKSVAFAELVARSASTAEWLQREVGVRPGERLVIALETCLEFLELVVASWRLKLQVIVIPPTASRGSFEGIVASLRPAAVVFDGDNERLRGATIDHRGPDRELGDPGAPKLVRAMADDERVLLGEGRPTDTSGDWTTWIDALPPAMFYTSGSTSTAKGVVLTWRGILAKGDAVLQLYGATPGERLMPILPMSHVYGLYLLMGCLLRGVDCAFERESARPAVFGDALVEHGVGYVVCPPVIGALVFGRARVDEAILRNLRVLSMGGAATPADLAARLVVNLPAARVFLSYGLVETYSTICSNEISLPGADASAVGTIRFGARGEVRDPATGELVEPGALGELCVGGTVTSGYVVDGKPQKTFGFTADGLFRTGDLVSVDARGVVSIRGRLKEMINAGGLSIMPSEIEDAIKGHAAVLDCAAFGETRGNLEVICAAVVLRGSPTADDPALVVESLFEHCKLLLSSKMVPRRIVPVSTIPRGSLGKVNGPALRALCAEAP